MKAFGISCLSLFLLMACKLPDVAEIQNNELPPASTVPTQACSEDNSICIETLFQALDPIVQIPDFILNPSFEDLAKRINSRQVVNQLNPLRTDLLLRIKNTGDEEIVFMDGADNNVLNFEASGSGVISIRNTFPVLTDFREGQAITLAPDQEHSVRFSFLGSGFRRAETYLYFFKEGSHLLRLNGRLSFRGNTIAERTPVNITTNSTLVTGRREVTQ